MSYLLPTFIVLMALIGTGTSRTRPSKCSRSSNYYPTSSSSEWQCGDSYCIDEYYVCDGILDCPNGRDEFNCEICRGESFHCDNKRCIARSLYCNGIDECEDGSDEPPSCPKIAIDLPDYNALLKDNNVKNIYGSLFGYAIGIIVLIFGIISAIIATVVVCACKRGCPLYKWRRRREEPPVGVIVADPNELYEDEPGGLGQDQSLLT